MPALADRLASLLPPRVPREERERFAEGLHAFGAPAMGIAAWGLVTGVAMARSGLTVPQALGMSLLVFAGSAQLASLPLIAAGLPVWTVLLTATVVNLRFVIFSAGIQPHFKALRLPRRLGLGYLNGDLNFVLFSRRYPELAPAPGQQGFFLGVSAANWVAWQVASVGGILLGSRIPEAWGVGFAGTLALVAVLVPLAAGRSAAAAVAVGAVVACLAFRLPWRLNLVAAVAAAVATGMALDEVSSRRRRAADALAAVEARERRELLDGEEMPE